MPRRASSPRRPAAPDTRPARSTRARTAAARPKAEPRRSPEPRARARTADTPPPAAPAPNTTGAPLERLHDQLAEGGQMQQEPRGGWRFSDPREDAAHGAAAPLPPLTVPRKPDPFDVAQPGDEAREAFEGDPQNPAHGYPRGGTQGTWDGSIPAPAPSGKAPPHVP